MGSDTPAGPSCSERGCSLVEHRKSQIAVYDLPLADRTSVWLNVPAIQGHCPECRCYVTPRPPEIHPLRDGTWRLMRRVAVSASIRPDSTVAAMFDISESTVRRYEMDVLHADLPEPLLDDIELLLIDEKAVRKGHGHVTLCALRYAAQQDRTSAPPRNSPMIIATVDLMEASLPPGSRRAALPVGPHRE